MNWNEWKSIKEWDIIYSTRTKRPRTVIKFSQKSNCATLENWTVYCLWDKYLFDKNINTIFNINMTTRTQTFFTAWIWFCIITHIDLQTIHLTDSVDMVKIAGEQLIFTNRFGFVALVLALGSYIFDIIDK